MSWLIIGVGGRACHLELSPDTRLQKRKSAGVSVRARTWVLVILPAAITSTAGLPNRKSSVSPWLCGRKGFHRTLLRVMALA
ncbi:hypothetical protein CesoFtcFv8_027776 [Champsocephalus esox]|uniref:Uncharacterized protein n=2 Tax=Champsocephalus TaxID=52236 RepID=A0AAN8BWM4_CHAGU|nr:hypothetical protein CesoFtcFv8_027776 [Champsocephalus esox]KAK5891495.1 hypothetical protein CgunFtcFv8_018741 [Champsocephalus gunnari]